MRPYLVPIAIFSMPLPALAASVEVHPGDDIVTLTASLGAGSEVIFSGGTYEIQNYLTITATGSDTAPVVLRAAAGETPVLEFSGNYHVVRVENAQYVELRGLTIQGGEGWEEGDYIGIQLETSSYITISDCVIQNVPRSGIYIGGDAVGIVVEHTEIGNVGDGAGIYAGCGDATCWTQDSTFHNNWVHDVGFSDDDDGISLEDGDNNNVVSDNVVYNTSRAGIVSRSTEYSAANTITGNVVWGAVQYGIRTDGEVLVQNNVVYDVDGYGIYSRNGDRNTLQNGVISHNTIANTSNYGIRLEGWSGKEGMVLANNVVINPTGLGLDLHEEGAIGDGNYLSHNVVSGYVYWKAAAEGEEGQGVTFAEAILPGAGYEDVEDVESADFYPDGSSTLVDAGDDAANAFVPATDFNGAAREGDAPDVGAYERSGDGNPGWTLSEGFKELGVKEEAAEIQGGCCKGKEEDSAGALVLVGLLGARWRKRR